MQESVMMENPTICDEHGWHEGNWCYHCKFDALEMRHDQTVDELDLMRKQVDEYKTKERMAIEQAQRFSDEANEMRSALD